MNQNNKANATATNVTNIEQKATHHQNTLTVRHNTLYEPGLSTSGLTEQLQINYQQVG